MSGHAGQDAFVLLQRAAARLQDDLAELVKERGLTSAQYNVLRILRGAHPKLLCCGEIAERMMARDPDITRLLDRMTKTGLVERARGEKDRRVVLAGITSEGLALLKDMDGEVAALHRQQFAGLGAKKTENLLKLLKHLTAG